MGAFVRQIIMSALILILGYSSRLTVVGVPNTNITSVLCNSASYTTADPFAESLAYVLTDLEEVTPSRNGHDYYNISPFPIAFAYGHATCGQNLSDSDCSLCLVSSAKVMNDSCFSSVGARAVLYDCSIRYEQYPFTA